MRVRDRLIKLLGGYTKKEYNRVEQQYQALLDSRTTDKDSQLVNEYLFRLLRDLDRYARRELYGIPLNFWVRRMYNVIHNNLMRLMCRYLFNNSNMIYKLDTTLEGDDQFKKIYMKSDGYDPDELDYFILEND